MSDVEYGDEELDGYAESRAEDQWAAEYVDPYRGVPLPEGWSERTYFVRQAWREGVDAALAVNADVISRCNQALQQVTGGRS